MRRKEAIYEIMLGPRENLNEGNLPPLLSICALLSHLLFLLCLHQTESHFDQSLRIETESFPTYMLGLQFGW